MDQCQGWVLSRVTSTLGLGTMHLLFKAVGEFSQPSVVVVKP